MGLIYILFLSQLRIHQINLSVVLNCDCSGSVLFWFCSVLVLYCCGSVLVLYCSGSGSDVHSSRSARVLVLRATGRLVLSLVMANSCIPSSSATLACVLLLTRELRRSCRQTPGVTNVLNNSIYFFFYLQKNTNKNLLQNSFRSFIFHWVSEGSTGFTLIGYFSRSWHTKMFLF